jgi:hypothetical protein
MDIEKESEALALRFLEKERLRLEAIENARRQYEIENLAYEKIRLRHIYECSNKGLESMKMEIFTLIFNPYKYYEYNTFHNEVYTNSPLWNSLRNHFNKKEYSIQIGNNIEHLDVNKLVNTNQWDILKAKYYNLLEIYCPKQLRKELDLIF